MTMTPCRSALAVERMASRRRVAAAEARFQALVEHACEAIALFDADGTITYCSPSTGRVLGWAVDELVGRNVFELIHPVCDQSLQAQLKQSLGNPRQRIAVHAAFPHKDGTLLALEGTLTNLLEEPSVRGIVANFRDVTGAKELEEQLHWLRLAVDQSPAAVLITNTSGDIEYVNRKFSENTGYSAEEVLGKNPRLLQSGLTPRSTYERLWQAMAANRSFRGEFRNRRKNGELYWNDVQISPIRSATGRATRYLGVQTDITSYKAVEGALRESNERFHQLADGVDDVFFVMDSQCRETLYINPAYERLWGRSRQSLYDDPRSFTASVVPEDLPALLADIQANAAGETTPPCEFRIVRPDGTIRWARLHATGIRNGAGEVYRISGVATDITEQREAQSRLEEAAARYRRLVEASFDAIVISERGVIVDANAAFASMFGLENEQSAVGRRTMEFAAPESTEEVRNRSENNIEEPYEFVGRRQDGKDLLVEVQARAVSLDGRPARVTALRDVTEKRSLEAQFRQAQKMEAVGRLAGGVAHDFNNLLTVITGHAELLQMDLISGDPRAESLAQIEKAANDAASLTRQLLTFSRQQVIEPRTIALEEVVAKSTKLLQHLIGEDIDIAMRLGSPPCTIRIDPGQLEQVIMNLAVNARDAMPTGGNLTIETALVEVDDARAQTHWPAMAGHFALLSVSDNGVGMDAATQKRIFEPFFTTKGPGQGTGLGLATVYGIVEQSGGFISVYSEPGLGTTFKVYLPLSGDAVVPELGSFNVALARGGIETVLLVEDAAAVRDIARRALERLGYRVLATSDPLEALQIARLPESRIGLLLTDVVMPQMNGRVLAERFAALHPDARVLFMSGYTDDAIVRNGVLSAEMPYLQKPFTTHVLATKVRHVLDTR